MLCNPSTCKEKIRDIPQCDNLILLGVTLRYKFNEHVREAYSKLKKAKICLYILRTLRKEQYNQTEIDRLFRSLVLPNITYGLSIFVNRVIFNYNLV